MPSCHCESFHRRTWQSLSPKSFLIAVNEKILLILLQYAKEMVPVIEGKNPVIELLKSGHPISKILLADSIKPGEAVAEILRLAKTKNIPVERVPRHIIDKQSVTDVNQGVIAYAAARKYVSLDDLLAVSVEKNEPPLYVILDGIEDPQTLGSILRTAYASGVHGVIIRERRAPGITAAVATASAGGR